MPTKKKNVKSKVLAKGKSKATNGTNKTVKKGSQSQSQIQNIHVTINPKKGRLHINLLDHSIPQVAPILS